MSKGVKNLGICILCQIDIKNDVINEKGYKYYEDL